MWGCAWRGFRPVESESGVKKRKLCQPGSTNLEKRQSGTYPSGPFKALSLKPGQDLVEIDLTGPPDFSKLPRALENDQKTKKEHRQKVLGPIGLDPLKVFKSLKSL